jgi:hypothetical protein
MNCSKSFGCEVTNSMLVKAGKARQNGGLLKATIFDSFMAPVSIALLI